MTLWKHVIGILGGMGPHAHIEFESLLLDATAKALGRHPLDQDYPPWIVSSVPGVPDRTRALLEGTESPVEAMVEAASRLEGASFAVIPCNTAHAFLEAVRRRVSVPFLDMIRVTAERVVERVGERGCVGLLAASGTIHSGIYRKTVEALAPRARVVTLFDLDDGEALQERLVMEPIFGSPHEGRRAGGGIKSGAFRDPKCREALAARLSEAVRKLADAGASLVLTACTEIPLVLGRKPLPCTS